MRGKMISKVLNKQFYSATFFIDSPFNEKVFETETILFFLA